MLVLKAYKFKLKMTPDLEKKCHQMAGCCRFVWNKALSMNLERLKNKQKLLWYHELAFWLTFWKKTEELNFLKGCHSQALQQTIKNLDRAFKDAFDKKQSNKRVPVFKRKWEGDSFSYPQGFKVVNKRVFLPKIGWVAFHKSREIEGDLKNLIVKREVDGWYISIQVEQELPEPVHSSQSVVGVDLGITRFATLSNGQFFRPENHFREYEGRLARAQKKLARQQKFSENWKKQKKKIGKIHHKIKNCRLDDLHKISNTISKNHAMVVLEDLQVKNMSKSAKGSVEIPGTKVKAKSGLNKSILDQGWAKLREFLRYKLHWLGGELVTIDPRYTSQTCPKCKNIDSNNRLTQSKFECVKCSYRNNADVVGAMNILAAGLAVMVCQANLMKRSAAEICRKPQGSTALALV